MKLNKISLFIFFLLFRTAALFGQSDEKFLFPIKPGQKNYLAGTMGELRSSHFHAGIDIKTGGQEGWNVYATQRGYITRIKVSTSGYGNALYMLHPDGKTSVYAHLRDFDEQIEKYVKEAQYKHQKFEIELFPEPYEFAFKQGDVIAKSGNTGGSTGPHLHFEIRDEQQRVLNPLDYGFDEIKDNIAPIAQKLAIRPVNKNSRVGNKIERETFELSRSGINYFIKDTITAFGKIGMELLAHDKLDGAANKNGVSTIEVYVNDDLYHSQNIEIISFSYMRDILVHYPYDVKVNKGSTYHKLYVDDGNRLNFYQSKENDGYLSVEAGKKYKINIKMFDPYGNQSELSFHLKGKSPDLVVNETPSVEIDKIYYEVKENLLKIFTATDCPEDSRGELSVYINDSIKTIIPSYFLKNIAVYLWDLNEGIPASILSCEAGEKININQQIFPLEEKEVEAENFKVKFTSFSLYDTAFISTSYEVRTQDSLEIFAVQPVDIPLKSSIYFTVQPMFSNYQKEKTHIYQTDDAGNFSFVGGSWTGETIEFSNRSMGEYTLLTDSVPPLIKALSGEKSFIIDDKLSGISSYTATLNGEWVLMKYEPKQKLIWIEWPEAEIAKEGEFILTVEDRAGNKTVYTTKL